MSDDGLDVPPPEALGDDRPSDNDDALDDTAPEFSEPANALPLSTTVDDSDDDSLLSEVDEAQFADFDAAAVQIAPDLETLNRTIKAKKRKRVEGDDAAKAKKKKEGTREKVKKNKRLVDSDDNFSGGEQIDGKRKRKSHPGTDGERKKRPAMEINDEDLTPEERRRRALDKAMDAALKGGKTKSRARKGEIDLEAMADQEISDMRNRMQAAAEADADAVTRGEPASAKLKMLPEVLSLLNRNTYIQALLDPDTNILEAVRFFLEPLSDGSLPAYNIQRDLFAALAKLPMNKETLIASGLGKVIMFYKKSKRPEPAIKRQATKLMEEWSRPILQRSDDYTKRVWETAVFDPTKRRDDLSDGTTLKVKERQTVAPGQKVSNRARILPGVTSYKIVPQSVNVMARR